MKTENFLFFGLTTGRTGSISLSKALNEIPNIRCFHEGFLRNSANDKRYKYFNDISMINNLKYQLPGEDISKNLEIYANNIVMKYPLENIQLNKAYGDIAYYLSSCFDEIKIESFKIKYLFMHREPKQFIRSSTSINSIDNAPLAWPPESKKLSTIERYISLGRLRPKAGTPHHLEWEFYPFYIKNAWLWAETNKNIYTRLKNIHPKYVKTITFNDFIENPLKNLTELAKWLTETDISNEYLNNANLVYQQKTNKRDEKDKLDLKILRKKDKLLINDICRETCAMLGYQEPFIL